MFLVIVKMDFCWDILIWLKKWNVCFGLRILKSDTSSVAIMLSRDKHFVFCFVFHLFSRLLFRCWEFYFLVFCFLSTGNLRWSSQNAPVLLKEDYVSDQSSLRIKRAHLLLTPTTTRITAVAGKRRTIPKIVDIPRQVSKNRWKDWRRKSSYKRPHLGCHRLISSLRQMSSGLKAPI